MANGEVFSGIAARYDRLNAVLSLGRDQAWRRRVVRHLPRGLLLDLGAGTGAALPVFADRRVVAIDPAPEMLVRNPAAWRVGGVGEALPFRDGVFDAVFSAYVFRNLTSVPRTMTEVARVLRPGGRLGVVGLGRPEGRFRAALHRAGTAVVLPAAGMTIGAREEYRYLHRSLDRFPRPEVLLAGHPGFRLEMVFRMGSLGFVYGAVLRRS